MSMLRPASRRIRSTSASRQFTDGMPGARARATVSRVVDEVARLSALVDASGWSLGQVSTAIHTLVALAPDGGQGGGIWLDGALLLTADPGPGITLALLDSALQLKFGRTYDTVRDLSASQLLGLDIEQHARRLSIAVGITGGAYLTQLGAEGRTALTLLGAAALWQSPRPPGAAAFIGIVAESMVGPGVASLVSVVPSDATGEPAVLPFAWGVYSTERQCFIAGGASGNLSAQPLRRVDASSVNAVMSSRGPMAQPAPRLAASPLVFGAPSKTDLRSPLGAAGLGSPPAQPPLVSSLTVDPSTVTLPSAATGTITLSAPAPPGGLTVTLSTSDPLVAIVPTQLGIPVGQITAAFTVWPLKTGTVNVHASVADSPTFSAPLEIKPA